MPPDDLCFLLRSPLFLYAISPRLYHDSDHATAPRTFESMTTRMRAHIFDIAYLEIHIKWDKNSWATQLTHGDGILLEGRERNVRQELGFVQSFLWFCEEASFLAHEYKAREDAWAARKGDAVDVGAVVKDDGANGGWKAPARSNGKGGRRSLKLLLRLKNTARGPAGVSRLN
jgi:hypothetical protein